MTELLAYSVRIANGENTLERSIIACCLRLHQVTKDKTTLKDRIKIIPTIVPSDTGTTFTFNAQVDLDIDSAVAIAHSFDLIGAVINYPNTSALLPIEPVSALTGLTESLPQEPTEVDSLEKFTLWLVLVLANSVYPETKYFSLIPFFKRCVILRKKLVY